MESDFAYSELLYEAIASPCGICVETDSAERLRQKLYPIRKADPDLACLSFVISPLNGKDLWIIKHGVPNAEGS